MKKIILYLCIGSLTLGCEDVIELDLNTAAPRLAIDARLKVNPNEQFTQLIKLSLTGGFYNQNTTVVTNANVQLLDLTNSTIHTFIHDSNTPGNYTLDFIPSLNTNYKLTINYNNEVYESSVEQLMPTVPIDNLEQGGETLFQGDEKEVLVTITDDGSREDYYIFDFGYNLFLATKDEFYQGNSFTFSYFYDDLEAGDTAEISIYGANERYFNFMTAIIEQTEEGGDPFDTTPTTVRGNLYNITNPSQYPLGYFSIGETYSASLLLE
ncbi:MAG: hypothetical protein O2906_02665 [Bacteroidetes bacterium]|nr:hypothetical protein [Bacteroidota bacterium]MDA0859860.1 hypothetical protein [Bacteroidota bacterium]MDA1317554.1 hypothetical protein [Bacteroidota bacterium]